MGLYNKLMMLDFVLINQLNNEVKRERKKNPLLDDFAILDKLKKEKNLSYIAYDLNEKIIDEYEYKKFKKINEKKQYTKNEKVNYYRTRVNDKKLTKNQRLYAENRLKKLMR